MSPGRSGSPTPGSPSGSAVGLNRLPRGLPGWWMSHSIPNMWQRISLSLLSIIVAVNFFIDALYEGEEFISISCF